MAFSSDFFKSKDDFRDCPPDGNELLNYLQHQSPEVLSRVAKSVTPDIRQIVNQNVQGLLGMLPQEGFNVQITSNRENLSGLLVSAMMTGYFLRQMEQRMELESQVLEAGFDALEADQKPDSSQDS